MKANRGAGFANSLENARLEAAIWKGPPPVRGAMYFEDPGRKGTQRYRLGYSAAGAYVWLPPSGQGEELSDEATAERLLGWYLDNA